MAMNGPYKKATTSDAKNVQNLRNQWNAVTNHIVPLTLRSKESAQKQISALMLLRYIHVQRGIIAVRV